MLICLARVYGMLALREGVCWVRGLCEDLLGVDLPSGASACQRKKRYLTDGDTGYRSYPIHIWPCAHSEGTEMQGVASAFQTSRQVCVWGIQTVSDSKVPCWRHATPHAVNQGGRV